VRRRQNELRALKNVTDSAVQRRQVWPPEVRESTARTASTATLDTITITATATDTIAITITATATDTIAIAATVHKHTVSSSCPPSILLVNTISGIVFSEEAGKVQSPPALGKDAGRVDDAALAAEQQRSSKYQWQPEDVRGGWWCERKR
jgi:hypothetical protein